MKPGLYKLLGFLFLGIAMLGIVLPVLPTTPFLLLSAWFFARSSEKWHRWLLDSRLFGPMIRNWEENRCISRRTKVIAITSMALVGGSSIYFAMETLWMRLFTALLLVIGCGVVLSMRSCQTAPEQACE